MKKLTAPKSVRIGAHKFKITLVNASNSDQDGSAGHLIFNSGDLKVATLLPDGSRRSLVSIEQVLWHEIIHGINFAWSIGLDEDNIDRMAEGLTQVLRQWKLNAVKET